MCWEGHGEFDWAKLVHGCRSCHARACWLQQSCVHVTVSWILEGWSLQGHSLFLLTWVIHTRTVTSFHKTLSMCNTKWCWLLLYSSQMWMDTAEPLITLSLRTRAMIWGRILDIQQYALTSVFKYE